MTHRTIGALAMAAVLVSAAAADDAIDFRCLAWRNDEGLQACLRLLGEGRLSPAQAAAVDTIVADNVWERDEGRRARQALEDAARRQRTPSR